MLYYLFDYLDKAYDIPGAGVFRFLSFRASMAIITSLVITLFLGKRIIRHLLRMQVGETIRDLGLDGQQSREHPLWE
jgi:phospho-N-acetylmuramoyl-pentapeptide-transferase